MKKSQSVITVNNVSKSFRLPHERQSSVKGKLINFRKQGFETQRALQDVSFEVRKGEFLGVVGRNGSGKSTLLKLISGIYSPTAGTIDVIGKLVPFIELGVGFSPELSGRDNVYLNGALLGFTRSEIDAMYEEIVEFAELHNFMDQKLKNYSSGMQVRLAFSIAIKVSADVLVLDEVLAVGDAAFQQKCFDYFMNLKRQKKTVILVTHDMGAVRQYCDRAILIEKGIVAEEGSPEKIAGAYQQLFIDELEDEGTTSVPRGERWGTGEIRTIKTSTKVTDEAVTITTSYEARAAVDHPVFGLSIYSPSDIGLVDANTFQVKQRTPSVKKGTKIDLVWEIPNVFVNGKYRVSVGCTSSSMHKILDQVANSGTFRVKRETPTGGIIFPDVKLQQILLDGVTLSKDSDPKGT